MAPVNVFLHSLFSQVDMTLNGTVVTAANNMYPYRSYIETLLSYGSDAKRSQLTSELFYKDDAGRFDTLEMDGANANSGFVKRNVLIRAVGFDRKSALRSNASKSLSDQRGEREAKICQKLRRVQPVVSQSAESQRRKRRAVRAKSEIVVVGVPRSRRSAAVGNCQVSREKSDVQVGDYSGRLL